MTEPIVPATPVVAVVDASIVVPPVAGDAGESKILSVEQLNHRIAQAKRSSEADTRAAILKELGVDTIDTAKSRVAAAKKLEDDAKSELDKRDERIKQLEVTAGEVVSLKQAITERASDEMAALVTDAHREMVKGLAGDDAAKQLATISTLRKGGAFAPPVDPKTGKPAVPPPANTSAAGAAPPPANPNAPNHQATLESLEKSNPMAAAHYALRHQGEIYKGGGS